MPLQIQADCEIWDCNKESCEQREGMGLLEYQAMT